MSLADAWFYSDRKINPETGRRIKSNGKIYRELYQSAFFDRAHRFLTFPRRWGSTDDLPDELVQLIFQHLDYPDLCAVSETCRRYFELSRERMRDLLSIGYDGIPSISQEGTLIMYDSIPLINPWEKFPKINWNTVLNAELVLVQRLFDNVSDGLFANHVSDRKRLLSFILDYRGVNPEKLIQVLLDGKVSFDTTRRRVLLQGEDIDLLEKSIDSLADMKITLDILARINRQKEQIARLIGYDRRITGWRLSHNLVTAHKDVLYLGKYYDEFLRAKEYFRQRVNE
ncbi:MAG: F-box-like domain-containing protein [Sulfobacillus sp.]